MRLHGLTLLALMIGSLGVQEARASSDDSCYPSWNLKRDTLDVCNSLPFLSPGNDSRVNLQLLLADAEGLDRRVGVDLEADPGEQVHGL